METIFNHNITKSESRKLFGFDNYTPEEYCKGLSQLDCYRHIYCLYLIRGDKVKASKYAAKIPDSVEKVFGMLNHDFAI